MKVIIDCFGPDLGPGVMIEGASLYAAEKDFYPIFIGNEDQIKEELGKYSFKDYEIIHTDTYIENTEEPTRALRKKKDSSLVMALTLLKEGKADAVLSAGSTGGLLAGGLFLIGRKDGVERACLPVPIPKAKGHVCLLDAGANVDCSVDVIHSFAKMGADYVRKVYSVDQPKVYLLNIGLEPGKGNKQTKESFERLSQDPNLNFKGNIEARDVFNTDADVIVCDGFVGNIFLKTMEGFAEFIFSNFKNFLPKDSESQEKNPLSEKMIQLKDLFDYKAVGAVPLLGIKGLVFKAHGSSNAKAIYSSLKQIDQAINHKLVDEC